MRKKLFVAAFLHTFLPQLGYFDYLRTPHIRLLPMYVIWISDISNLVNDRGAFALNVNCQIGLSLKHIELVTGSPRSAVYKIDKR